MKLNKITKKEALLWTIKVWACLKYKYSNKPEALITSKSGAITFLCLRHPKEAKPINSFPHHCPCCAYHGTRTGMRWKDTWHNMNPNDCLEFCPIISCWGSYKDEEKRGYVRYVPCELKSSPYEQWSKPHKGYFPEPKRRELAAIIWKCAIEEYKKLRGEENAG